MIRVRKAGERGPFDHGWLDTCHTFSFADYSDPAHRGFRPLRVSNDDRVQPGMGFGMHGHQDLAAGDGVAVTGESAVSVQAAVPSEVLLFDLA
jgi:redox-sensitive bicupin YhaK (pirin superfamily)